jgi:acyl-CoA synthetase (NDP forming)
MFDVAQLLAHQPLPRGRRVAIVGNSDALGLLAADAANSVGLVVNRQEALGADATAEDFEDALDAAIDDPEVDAVVAIFIPPLNVAGAREDVANVLAAVGEQSDKPIVSTFLGTEGVPELLRVPDVAGSSAGRGSVPSYPAVEAAVRALAHVVEYAVWVRVPQATVAEPGVNDLDAARHLVNEVLMRHPEGRDLDFDEQNRLLRAYGIDLWDTYAVASLDEATTAGEALGWDVVLKATADHLRDRPDLAHVWRNIDNPDEMADAWGSLNALITDPDRAGFVVQRNAPPGVPVTIATMEDPLFGPVLSFGMGGPLTELLGDRSFRIPPLADHDAQDMVREIKASPLLFGYRGSEIVDVAEIERLVRQVAQLQHDLPQVRALQLPLVLAGAAGATVLGASVRVEPVKDPRSDWFVRRLSTMPGDTMPD